MRDDLKLRLLFLMESYIKLNDLDIHIAFYKNHFLFVFHDMEEELIYNEISSLISTLKSSLKKCRFMQELEVLSTHFVRFV